MFNAFFFGEWILIEADKKEIGGLGNYDFSRYPQILAVCLFGSRAEGKGHARSDLDIALVVKKDFKLLENYDLPLVLSSDLENLLNRKVDVVIFNKMDPLFQAEIRTKGKLIYARDRKELKMIFSRSRKALEDFLPHHEYYSKSLMREYLRHG